MRWRELADKPAVNWTALATFVGLLADFRGAAANITALIPVLQAFLPLIATAGAAFFGFRSVSYLTRWLWLRRPSARFGNCYAKIRRCRDSVAYQMPLSFGPFPYDVHSKIQELRASLERLGVRCPSVDPTTAARTFCPGTTFWLILRRSLSMKTYVPHESLRPNDPSGPFAGELIASDSARDFPRDSLTLH